MFFLPNGLVNAYGTFECTLKGLFIKHPASFSAYGNCFTEEVADDELRLIF